MRSTLRFPLASAVLLATVPVVQAQQHEVYEVPGGSLDQAGRSVAGLGDVDGDGVPDYAVGSPYHDSFGSVRGKLVVYSGKTGAVIRAHLGEADGDRFGWSVDGIGDIDGDGHDDYIIGAPLHDSGATPNCGKVYLHSGQSGSGMGSITLLSTGAQTGYSVCGLGDVSGDGVPDFAFGVPWADSLSSGLTNCGLLLAKSGADFSGLWTIVGTQDGGNLGYSVDAVGDLTGDGRPELVVGAPFEDVFATNNGRAYVLNGATGTTIFSRFGAYASGLFGYDVAGVGDVNGDGKPDVAFSEPWADSNGTNSGRVLVSSGAAPYAQLHQIVAPAGVSAGYSVAGIGDATGDGRADLAVGMPYANFFSLANVGWVYLISGATGSPFATLVGESVGDRLGVSVDGLGDLNGDGLGDLIAGAPWSDTNGTNAGLARVFLNGVPAAVTYCTAKTNSAGCTPSIESSGTPSASIADDFHVTAQDILYNVPGLLVWSYSSSATPLGGGTLCLAPPVFRTAGQQSGGIFGVPCSGGFDFHFSHAFLAAEGVAPGSTLYAQYWSRDTGFAAPNNMNLTDALQFVVVN